MTPRQTDIGVGIVAAGIVASVIAALVATTSLSSVAVARTSDVVAAAVPPLDLSPITRFAPFGTARTSVAGSPSALGLELRGVMLARPQAASTALIAAAGGPTTAFAVGATLPGGAVLDSVEYDLVVLRVEGRLETLAFPVKGASAVTPAGAAADDGPAPADEPDPADDGGTLLGTLGAAATPAGYRVGTAPSDDLLRAGIMPGDIVEKVGGQPVGDPARDRALLDDAAAAGKLAVEVVRAGRRLALSVPL